MSVGTRRIISSVTRGASLAAAAALLLSACALGPEPEPEEIRQQALGNCGTRSSLEGRPACRGRSAGQLAGKLRRQHARCAGARSIAGESGLARRGCAHAAGRAIPDTGARSPVSVRGHRRHRRPQGFRRRWRSQLGAAGRGCRGFVGARSLGSCAIREAGSRRGQCLRAGRLRVRAPVDRRGRRQGLVLRHSAHATGKAGRRHGGLLDRNSSALSRGPGTRRCRHGRGHGPGARQRAQLRGCARAGRVRARPGTACAGTAARSLSRRPRSRPAPTSSRCHPRRRRECRWPCWSVVPT